MQEKRTDVVDYLKGRHIEKIEEYGVQWKIKRELWTEKMTSTSANSVSNDTQFVQLEWMIIIDKYFR